MPLGVVVRMSFKGFILFLFPLEEHAIGNFNTFCPLEVDPRGPLIILPCGSQDGGQQSGIGGTVVSTVTSQ